ncbi:MAG: MFS transporter [Clostridia bacterium]|nr:MFS transporter [Clostridia bacterium]MBQ6121446.1 MFS transporter [Clostridia bacterium]
MVHILLVIIYLAFISLGLPDSLLGSAWPVMHLEFGVPISYAGAVSMIIAAGTIVSSLLSDRLTRRLGAGRVTAISVGMTAAALFGFSISRAYWMLLLWAIPYGLGAGSVDAALNNYVALHYASRHMSWLHCFWGVGASIGPAIMGAAIAGGMGWNGGYRIIGIMQIVLTAILVFSLPLWKSRSEENKADKGKPLSLRQIIGIPGAKSVMVCFFCYCALEQTTGLWASTFLVLRWGVSAEQAATLAGLFFIGITAGRAVGGFATFKFGDAQMVRIGQGIVLAGIALLLLPVGRTAAMIGFVAIGVGCAPIYPSLIHSTPDHFGADRSQAIIGVQMASAYLGTCLMPPLFGVLANALSVRLMPFYLLALLALMLATHEHLNRR